MSVNDTNLKQFWGDNLNPVPTSVASRIPLPKDTATFLTSIGLPKKPPLSISFYTDERLLQPRTFLGENYFVVGDDEGTTIGIEETSGEVYSVDFNGDLPLRFINSDIRSLINFLQTYLSRQSDLREATDEEAVAIVDALRSEFDRIDPKALEDPENWWSMILEQTELGLL